MVGDGGPRGNCGARRQDETEPGAPIKPGLLLAALATVLMGIALSLSRGGAIALVTATVTISVIYWRWRLVDGKYFFGLAGVGLLMLGLLSIYGYDQVSRRLDDFTSGSVEELDHGEGRRKVWQANIKAIEHGGLVGSGAGSHEEICPVYLSEPTQNYFTHAENGYLQITTENGWLGATLLAAGIALVGAWCMGCLRGLKILRNSFVSARQLPVWRRAWFIRSWTSSGTFRLACR